ncbi:MAG TPA: hypothetical protein PLU30_12230 [Verrucomicrobiae bacterium]|nr:hypothetical protein [Verrucomicrobiae bacterium]
MMADKRSRTVSRMKPVLSWLRDRLANTDQPVVGYAITAALISFVPSYAIGLLVSPLLVDIAPPFAVERHLNPLGFVMMVLVGPSVETVLMWPMLSLFGRMTREPTRQVIVSTVFWAILHGIAHPLWGFLISWPFFVFSMAFVAWKKRSAQAAILATGLTHSFHNLGVLISIAATMDGPANMP